MKSTIEYFTCLQMCTTRTMLCHLALADDRTLSRTTRCMLCSLTLLALAFAPLGGLGLLPSRDDREEVLLHAAVTQLAHAAFSIAAFYGETHIPTIGTWPSVFTELRSASRKV
jgi:ABC-type uncharacterized transport system permease subunit